MERNLQDEEYAGEAATNRAKRRKLDSGGHPRYGYRGEVVPGPLQMKILCCDGGYHQDGISQGRAYGEDNILRNNKSVYCTHKNRCNIVLCHQGETPFAVKKIVIKAPPRGYTSPIQEGMIFISMDDAGDLLKRTDQYQVVEESPDPPAYAHASNTEDSENEIPMHPSNIGTISTGRPPSRRAEVALTFPAPPTITTSSSGAVSPSISGLPRVRSRMIVDRNGIRRLYPEEAEINLVRIGLDSNTTHRSTRHRNAFAIGERQTLTPLAASRHHTTSPGPRNRPRLSPYTYFSSNAPTPSSNPNSAPLSRAQRSASRLMQPQSNHTTSPLPVSPTSSPLPQQDKFTVTMDCSDSSEDDEELSSPDILADLYRRDRTLYLDHSLDMEDESDGGEEGSNPPRPPRLGAMRDLGRRELPSRVQIIDLADVDDEEQEDGQSSQARTERGRKEKEGKGVVAPHARFFIEKEKSSVSVTFEPEV